jgi:hypothetical protein
MFPSNALGPGLQIQYVTSCFWIWGHIHKTLVTLRPRKSIVRLHTPYCMVAKLWGLCVPLVKHLGHWTTLNSKTAAGYPAPVFDEGSRSEPICIVPPTPNQPRLRRISLHKGYQHRPWSQWRRVWDSPDSSILHCKSVNILLDKVHRSLQLAFVAAMADPCIRTRWRVNFSILIKTLSTRNGSAWPCNSQVDYIG